MSNNPHAYDDLMRTVISFAKNSPDPSTQNAAMLFEIGDGWRVSLLSTLSDNDFPHGVQHTDERWQRPTKYSYVEHAERNAIYLAAEQGISTKGKGMVAVWASCADCARAIIQSGIVLLVRYQQDNRHWHDSTTIGERMLREAGVRIVTLSHPITGVPAIRRDGEEWLPIQQGESLYPDTNAVG